MEMYKSHIRKILNIDSPMFIQNVCEMHRWPQIQNVLSPYMGKNIH